jgi:hypothetical protein
MEARIGATGIVGAATAITGSIAVDPEIKDCLNPALAGEVRAIAMGKALDRARRHGLRKERLKWSARARHESTRVAGAYRAGTPHLHGGRWDARPTIDFWRRSPEIAEAEKV